MQLSKFTAFLALQDFCDYLLLGCLISWFIQLIYHAGIFSRLSFHKTPPPSNHNQPISVIICARNERENLLQFLPLFLDQDYPTFEVIVVNDASVDDTEDVLKAFSMQYQHLKVVNVPDNDRFYGSKKFALTLGIKAATYDHVLLTDADCKPTSKQWIQAMSAYGKGKEIILGFSAYAQRKGLLNQLIRFETFYTALQYLSFALIRVPYMGVGRNLAYKKKLFFDNKGFASHQHILSGDDDLFINEVASSSNTAIAIHEDAHTISIPKTSFKSWVRQKRRHYSAGKHYRLKHLLLLGFYHATLFLLFNTSIILLICAQIHEKQMVLVALLSRYLIQLVLFMLLPKRFINKFLALLTPFFELFFMFFNPLLVISNAINRKMKWN